MFRKEKNKKRKKPETFLGRLWYFIWEDNSLLSWLVNIVLAFILIKFIVYPGLGFIFGTTYPIVAVVSGSMEHKATPEICGTSFEKEQSLGFEEYWQMCGNWYEEKSITKEQFSSFSYKNGFNTGDLMVLVGKKPEKIRIGEIIVFKANRPDPIIHRVIGVRQEDGKYYFQTKGDHNQDSWGFETKISQDKLIGKALIKVPYLGWIKIGFVEFLRVIKDVLP